jgi:hypothetical protein
MMKMGPLQGGVTGMQPTSGLMTTADDPPGQSRRGMKKAECRMQNANRAQSWAGLWNPFRISGYCRRDNFCRPIEGERGGEAGKQKQPEVAAPEDGVHSANLASAVTDSLSEPRYFGSTMAWWGG